MQSPVLHKLSDHVNLLRVLAVLLAAGYVATRLLAFHFGVTSIHVWSGGLLLGGLAVCGMFGCIHIRHSDESPGTWRMFGFVLLLIGVFELYHTWALMRIGQAWPPPYLPDTLTRVHVYAWTIAILIMLTGLAFLIPIRHARWLLLIVVLPQVVVEHYPVFQPDNPEYAMAIESAERTGDAPGPSLYARFDETAPGAIPQWPDWPVKTIYFLILAYIFTPPHWIPRLGQDQPPNEPNAQPNPA